MGVRWRAASGSGARVREVRGQERARMPTVAAPSVQGEGVVRQRVRRLETLEQMPACETHRFEVCDERRPLALLPAAHVQLRRRLQDQLEL